MSIFMPIMNKRKKNTATSSPVALPWYLPTGVSAENCLAAYAAKGAASQAASYVNLVTPGLYDAYSTAEPTWNATNGWIFTGPGGDGQGPYLKTDVVIASKNVGSVFMQFTNAPAAGGSYHFSNGTTCSLSNNGDVMRTSRGSTAEIENAPALTSGNYGISGLIPYRNGVAESNIATSGVGDVTSTIFIACYNQAESPYAWTFMAIKIQAFVLYDVDLTPAQITELVTSMGGI